MSSLHYFGLLLTWSLVWRGRTKNEVAGTAYNGVTSRETKVAVPVSLSVWLCPDAVVDVADNPLGEIRPVRFARVDAGAVFVARLPELGAAEQVGALHHGQELILDELAVAGVHLDHEVAQNEMHRPDAARLEQGIIVGLLEGFGHLFLERRPERVHDAGELLG